MGFQIFKESKQLMSKDMKCYNQNFTFKLSVISKKLTPNFSYHLYYCTDFIFILNNHSDDTSEKYFANNKKKKFKHYFLQCMRGVCKFNVTMYS